MSTRFTTTKHDDDGCCHDRFNLLQLLFTAASLYTIVPSYNEVPLGKRDAAVSCFSLVNTNFPFLASMNATESDGVRCSVVIDGLIAGTHLHLSLNYHQSQ